MPVDERRRDRCGSARSRRLRPAAPSGRSRRAAPRPSRARRPARSVTGCANVAVLQGGDGLLHDAHRLRALRRTARAAARSRRLPPRSARRSRTLRNPSRAARGAGRGRIPTRARPGRPGCRPSRCVGQMTPTSSRRSRKLLEMLRRSLECGSAAPGSLATRSSALRHAPVGRSHSRPPGASSPNR